MTAPPQAGSFAVIMWVGLEEALGLVKYEEQREVLKSVKDFLDNFAK